MRLAMKSRPWEREPCLINNVHLVAELLLWLFYYIQLSWEVCCCPQVPCWLTRQNTLSCQVELDHYTLFYGSHWRLVVNHNIKLPSCLHKGSAEMLHCPFCPSKYLTALDWSSIVFSSMGGRYSCMPFWTKKWWRQVWRRQAYAKAFRVPKLNQFQFFNSSGRTMKFYALVFGNRFSSPHEFQDPGTPRSMWSKIWPEWAVLLSETSLSSVLQKR